MNVDSDHIFDSDHDNLQIDTDEERKPTVEDSSSKSSHGRSRCKKHGKNKRHKKNDHIDKVLAGTLAGINELFKSSNYTERINAYTK